MYPYQIVVWIQLRAESSYFHLVDAKAVRITARLSRFLDKPGQSGAPELIHWCRLACSNYISYKYIIILLVFLNVLFIVILNVATRIPVKHKAMMTLVCSKELKPDVPILALIASTPFSSSAKDPAQIIRVFRWRTLQLEFSGSNRLDNRCSATSNERKTMLTHR